MRTETGRGRRRIDQYAADRWSTPSALRQPAIVLSSVVETADGGIIIENRDHRSMDGFESDSSGGPASAEPVGWLVGSR